MAWRYFFPVVGGYLGGQVLAGELTTGRFAEAMLGSALGGLVGLLIFRWFAR